MNGAASSLERRRDRAHAAAALTLTAQTGFSRVVLQDQPLSVAGRHAVTARADFEPGANAGRHAHPGEELGYILEGTVELSVHGRPTVTLRPGDVFYIPTGAARRPQSWHHEGGPSLDVRRRAREPLATPVP